MKFEYAFSFNSIKSVIFLLFGSVIIVFLLCNTAISFLISEKQIKQNAYLNITDTVAQTQIFLDNRLSDIFEKLYTLENNNKILSIISKYNRIPDNEYQISDLAVMNDILDNLYASNYSILDSIFMYFNNGRFVIHKGRTQNEIIQFDFNAWRSHYNSSKLGYYWLNLHPLNLYKSDRSNEVFSVFKLIGNQDTKVNGIILFNLDKKFFENILANPQISRNGYLALISDDDVSVFKDVDAKYQMDSTVLNYLRDPNKISGQITFQRQGGVEMNVVYSTLKTNKWKLAAVFPEEDIVRYLKQVKIYTLFLLIGLIFVAVIFSNLIALFITKPVTEMKNKVKRVEMGDLEVKFDVKTNNEIGLLNRILNELLAKIKSLLEQARIEQENKRKAEIEIMQAQIKPHFLYNSLEAIRQLSDMQENGKASAMVEALANFYRLSISRGEEFITIQDEIDNIKNYLFIMQMRYSDKFDYEIKVSTEIMPYTIPKLLLQPLVENAIYHGIKQKRVSGRIRVEGYEQGDRIVLEVADDGIGIAPEALEHLQNALWNVPGKGQQIKAFGVLNVNERIKAVYGAPFGLQLESHYGHGTAARIVIPKIEKTEVLYAEDHDSGR